MTSTMDTRRWCEAAGRFLLPLLPGQWQVKRMDTLDARGGRWIDINVDEALAYTHLVRGDLEGTREAAGYAERAVREERRRGRPLPWVEAAYERVTAVMAAADRDPAETLDLLRANARRTARALRLPAPAL